MAQIPKLDRRIIELLEKPENADFTVRELRDQYAKAEGVESEYRSHLLRFIYRDIKKLRRAGFVELAEKRQKRNQRYYVCPDLSGRAVNPNGELFETWLARRNPKTGGGSSKGQTHEPDSAYRNNESTNHSDFYGLLEDRLQEVKAEFLETVGKAEEYKMLSECIPSLPMFGERFGEMHVEAKEQSLRLLGRIEAIEDVKKQLNHAD